MSVLYVKNLTIQFIYVIFQKIILFHQVSYPVRTALAVLEAEIWEEFFSDSSLSDSLELFGDRDSLLYLFMTGFTGDLKYNIKCLKIYSILIINLPVVKTAAQRKIHFSILHGEFEF